MFAMTIRKATTGDLSQLVAFDTKTKGLTERIADIKTAIIGGKCWVYAEKGAPAGYAVLQDDFFGRPFVKTIFVEPGSRRHGIATKLLTHLETVGGHDRLFTSTNQSNEPMRHLLNKMGYQQCGEIHGLNDNDPELVFIRALA